jgi:hypothetical protein
VWWGNGTSKRDAGIPAPLVPLLFLEAAFDMQACRTRPARAGAKRTVAMKLSLFRAVAFVAIVGTAASSAIAQHPRLLKRHGTIYAIRGLENFGGCKDYPPDEYCETYTLVGTIISVDYRKVGPEGFNLRMANGRTKYQNIISDLPPRAEVLIRPGRRVRVSGIMTGNGQVAVPSDIVAVGAR